MSHHIDAGLDTDSCSLGLVAAVADGIGEKNTDLFFFPNGRYADGMARVCVFDDVVEQIVGNSPQILNLYGYRVGWQNGRKIRFHGESCGLPYRSLIPVSFDNALTAGRCMGTDQKMQASIRVMPGCFITGQAAGCAAALATESGRVRSVDQRKLSEALLALGAYLPNYKSEGK